jgi:hypothetical protein
MSAQTVEAMKAFSTRSGDMSKAPIVLKGIVHGKTITLDGDTFLPDGYTVTLHLILTQEEALNLTAGAWANLTPEQVRECESLMTELDGVSVQMPEPDPS